MISMVCLKKNINIEKYTRREGYIGGLESGFIPNLIISNNI